MLRLRLATGSPRLQPNSWHVLPSHTAFTVHHAIIKLFYLVKTLLTNCHIASGDHWCATKRRLWRRSGVDQKNGLPIGWELTLLEPFNQWLRRQGWRHSWDTEHEHYFTSHRQYVAWIREIEKDDLFRPYVCMTYRSMQYVCMQCCRSAGPTQSLHDDKCLNIIL